MIYSAQNFVEASQVLIMARAEQLEFIRVGGEELVQAGSIIKCCDGFIKTQKQQLSGRAQIRDRLS